MPFVLSFGANLPVEGTGATTAGSNTDVSTSGDSLYQLFKKVSVCVRVCVSQHELLVSASVPRIILLRMQQDCTDAADTFFFFLQ